nr:DUF4942 domain-containing protein [uncultured Dyadobacter sp.]
MFSEDFYPTSLAAWEAMNVDCFGKRVLDPSAGKGDLLRYADSAGASGLEGIEKHDDLRRILSSLYPVIGADWFSVNPEDVSHVEMILMNPPYSDAENHILHAWKIAPEGCEIVAQCNAETISNTYSRSRKELKSLIGMYGNAELKGQLYKQAERTTQVEVAIVRLFKPVTASNPNFHGFYHDIEPENEIGGIVRYNEIQALVNSYTGAVRCFDKFAVVGEELNAICNTLDFGSEGFCFKVSSSDSERREGMLITKDEFSRSLQKRCWKKVFAKFNLEKYMTKGVLADVNKFVESRLNYPFTMRNIFRMIEIIVGTSQENMQKAIVEAVDNFTKHTHENRFEVEGWKTNSGHMLNRKFISGWIAELSWSGDGLRVRDYNSNFGYILDLTKALCMLTGKDYNKVEQVKFAPCERDESGELVKTYKYLNDDGSPKESMKQYYTIKDEGVFWPGKWYDWGFFRFKLFKKGTGHFEFRDIEDWAKLNQAYGKAKGNPLPEVIFKPRRSRKAA